MRLSVSLWAKNYWLIIIKLWMPSCVKHSRWGSLLTPGPYHPLLYSFSSKVTVQIKTVGHMIEFPPLNSRAFLPTFSTDCPDGPGVSFCPDGVIPRQPLFFTQQSHTTFGNMYRAYTKHPNPSPEHQCSWPEPESLQNELPSGHPGPQLGKMFEKWTNIF